MVTKLIDISRQLGFKDLEDRLLAISATLNNGQAELIVPVVGEFSAICWWTLRSMTTHYGEL